MSKKTINENELEQIAGGHGKRSKKRVSSRSADCALGFKGKCNSIGVTKDGVVSYEPCNFLIASEEGDLFCGYEE